MDIPYGPALQLYALFGIIIRKGRTKLYTSLPYSLQNKINGQILHPSKTTPVLFLTYARWTSMLLYDNKTNTNSTVIFFATLRQVNDADGRAGPG